MKNKIIQACGFALLSACMIITALFLAGIIYFIAVNGRQALSWQFLTAPPLNGMSAGGVAPAIVGTFYLTMGSVIFALPLGVGCAVYLQEYSAGGRMSDIIRVAVNNLAGVPSVVFGLFGLGIFVKFLGFGVSILSGSLTLGILILPGIISASQEALLAVPVSFKEASLAIGATKWQTIKRIILPCALPGILTGVILGIGRAAGETAPILFTAAAFYKRGYPNSLFSEVMALPYHIYALMTEGVNPEKQTAIAYGCALILVAMVALMSSLAIFIRNKYRSAYGNGPRRNYNA
ncbi:MAG: phosphate ABC transporter permease PstA [Elusimicrobiota bacterium]|jgi:phosphate transport system permease protein|nr:phosphate ABC transporter permease PstA [Elusimicrobiota bacterium]